MVRLVIGETECRRTRRENCDWIGGMWILSSRRIFFVSGNVRGEDEGFRGLVMFYNKDQFVV